jgi:aspartate/methionine/tyrosine aminotransferase/elongation factor P--beta-lysine ligase
MRPLVAEQAEALDIIPLAQAQNEGRQAMVAGWIVEAGEGRFVMADGTARLEVEGGGVKLALGDLVVGEHTQSLAPPVRNVRVLARVDDAKVAERLAAWGNASEEDRYRFRYLTLRDPEFGSLIRQASDFRCRVMEFFRKRGFIYVDTPLLGRTQAEYTDDDYVVVSRYSDRGVYTLPQSAQFYKQLAMGSGVWKYFQLAKCLRDEAIRSDTLTEFTQIDIELSFTSQEQLMTLFEEFVAEMFQAIAQIALPRPFPRISMAQALSEYGTDKPALRTQNSPVAVFVTDMPIARRDENGCLRRYHHPMAAPDARHLPLRADDDVTRIRSTGFDLVIGGIEIGSGNMRISDPDLQLAMLGRFGLNEQDRRELMGTLVEALRHGFPEHGGFAVGFERMLMAMRRQYSAADFLAFPRLRKDFCPLTESPFMPKAHLLEQCAQRLRDLANAGPGAAQGRAAELNVKARPSAIAEIAAEIVRRGGCRYPLHVGDSHLTPPEAFSRSVAELSRSAAAMRYSCPGGMEDFRRVLAQRYAAQARHTVGPEQVLVCNGATEATQAIIRTLLKPGYRAAVLSPSWQLIREQLHDHGCAVDEIPFFGPAAPRDAGGAEILLQRALRENIRLLYFANPNNPDGAVLSEPILSVLLELAARRGIWILADEVHEEQVYLSGAHQSARRILPTYDRLITVHSFSKLLGLPGIRVGHLVAHADVIPPLSRALQNSTFCVPIVWQKACGAALADADFLKRQHETFEHSNLATARALGIPPAAGGIYHFFRIRGEAASVARSLLRECDIALAPGEVGGSGFGSWLRFCFTAVPPEDAIRAAESVKQWLHERELL